MEWDDEILFLTVAMASAALLVVWLYLELIVWDVPLRLPY